MLQVTWLRIGYDKSVNISDAALGGREIYEIKELDCQDGEDHYDSDTDWQDESKFCIKGLDITLS